jgi:hypothetical protein
VATSRQVKGSQSLLRAAAITLCNPVYWHEGGGGASPGLSGELSVLAGGVRGAAAGDHEGEPCPHWSWALWLNTVTSLTVGFECVVLIFMAGQRLTWMSRSGHVTDFWHPTGIKCATAANQIRSADVERTWVIWRRRTAFSCRSTSSSASLATSRRQITVSAPSRARVSWYSRDNSTQE